MPGADHALPATISQWHSLTKLSTSIKTVLEGGTHKTPTGSNDPSQFPCSFNICRSEKPTNSCSPRIHKRRGANSTCTHERHREAPLREARQAAPDGARASAALSLTENSRFSRETEPLRRKVVCLLIHHFNPDLRHPQIRQEPSRQQHRRRTGSDVDLRQMPFPSPLTVKMLRSASLSPRRTESYDENLRANPPGRRRAGQGGGGGRRAHNLDASVAAPQSNGFHRTGDPTVNSHQ